MDELIDSLTEAQLKEIAWAGSWWVDMERYEDGGVERFRQKLKQVIGGPHGVQAR